MFDWDEHNLEHIVRHGSVPSRLRTLFWILAEFPFPAGSGRVGFIGMTEAGRVLVVILDRRRDLWRVTTARDASPNEKKSYRRRQ